MISDLRDDEASFSATRLYAPAVPTRGRCAGAVIGGEDGSRFLLLGFGDYWFSGLGLPGWDSLFGPVYGPFVLWFSLIIFRWQKKKSSTIFFFPKKNICITPYLNMCIVP